MFPSQFHQCRDYTFLHMIDFTNQETYNNDKHNLILYILEGGWINKI